MGTRAKESGALIEDDQRNDNDRARGKDTQPLRAQTLVGVSQACADETDARWYRKWQFRVNVLTFLAVAVYAYFAHQQVDQMLWANREERTRNRAELRPYVAVRSDAKPATPDWARNDKGERTGIQICFENAGVTPALRFVANGAIKNGKPLPALQHLDMPSHASNIRGIEILSHATFCRTFNIEPSEVEGLEKTMGISYLGSFEYTNVFDEYCCNPFQLIWDKDRFGIIALGESDRTYVCPNDRPNICEPAQTDSQADSN